MISPDYGSLCDCGYDASVAVDYLLSISLNCSVVDQTHLTYVPNKYLLL